MKLKRDIVDKMPWTMSHLDPDILVLGEKEKSFRYTTVAVKTGHYCLVITRDGGDDFWANVTPSLGTGRSWRIDVVAQALDEMHHWNNQPELLMGSLSDIDSLVQWLDPLLREAFSSQNLDKTCKTLADYEVRHGRDGSSGRLQSVALGQRKNERELEFRS